MEVSLESSLVLVYCLQTVRTCPSQWSVRLRHLLSSSSSRHNVLVFSSSGLLCSPPAGQVPVPCDRFTSLSDVFTQVSSLP